MKLRITVDAALPHAGEALEAAARRHIAAFDDMLAAHVGPAHPARRWDGFAVDLTATVGQAGADGPGRHIWLGRAENAGVDHVVYSHDTVGHELAHTVLSRIGLSGFVNAEAWADLMAKAYARHAGAASADTWRFGEDVVSTGGMFGAVPAPGHIRDLEHPRVRSLRQLESLSRFWEHQPVRTRVATFSDHTTAGAVTFPVVDAARTVGTAPLDDVVLGAALHRLPALSKDAVATARARAVAGKTATGIWPAHEIPIAAARAGAKALVEESTARHGAQHEVTEALRAALGRAGY